MGLTFLHRVNLERNEKRFYLVFTAPSLFYTHAVTRFWGRTDGHQRGLIRACESAEEADRLADRLIRQKLKRGYVIKEKIK